MPKDILAIHLCEDKWPKFYEEWSKSSPISNDTRLDNQYNWFSQPSVDSNGSVRFHFTDCCHILTCLRTKICTSGIYGLSKDAWISAAKSDETQLNIAIVLECVDKQSVAFAKRVFAEDVENFMIKNDFTKEVIFVRLIRRWFESEDDPGISSIERCNRRIDLKNYLLCDISFGRFPPHIQYVKGIPITTYESLLANIEVQHIYTVIPTDCYNVRSLGTQEVEQFFSTVRDLDPSGLGTPKPDDIPSIMATTTLLDNTRMDPNRSFHMKTTRAAVHPEAVFHHMECQKPTDTKGTTITVKDHFFDATERKRTKAKRKSGTVKLPDQPSNREIGVREYHRCDESKILAHQRKGLEDI